LAAESETVVYPWESPENARWLTARAREGCPEWYTGPVFAYSPTYVITRHYIDTIQHDDTNAIVDFVRTNLGVVATAAVTTLLAGAVAALLYEGVRTRLGPVGLVSLVLLTVALVVCTLGLLGFALAERPNSSSRVTRLEQLRPSYDEDSRETPFFGGSKSSLERNIQLVLKERIALWITGVAVGLDSGMRLDLTEGFSSGFDDKWAQPLRETLGLTPTQFARFEKRLLDELRSAASHNLIGGHWGSLVDRDGRLVVERRSVDQSRAT
jgi:hypothetical protein